jgi:hypothetical protein
MDRPGGPAARPPIDVYARLIKGVQQIRAIRLFRTSSAMVRWIILVAVIGFGAALLVAFAVSLLVSLIPSTGG